jgi:hypothetical protein
MSDYFLNRLSELAAQREAAEAAAIAAASPEVADEMKRALSNCDRLQALFKEELARWSDSSRYGGKTVEHLVKYDVHLRELRVYACEARDPKQFTLAWKRNKLAFAELKRCFHRSKPDYAARAKLAQQLLSAIAQPMFRAWKAQLEAQLEPAVKKQ